MPLSELSNGGGLINEREAGGAASASVCSAGTLAAGRTLSARRGSGAPARPKSAAAEQRLSRELRAEISELRDRKLAAQREQAEAPEERAEDEAENPLTSPREGTPAARPATADGRLRGGRAGGAAATPATARCAATSRRPGLEQVAGRQHRVVLLERLDGAALVLRNERENMGPRREKEELEGCDIGRRGQGGGHERKKAAEEMSVLEFVAGEARYR